MKTTAADILMDTIYDCGVEVVFGLPGDSINRIMESLRKRADKMRFIQVRHEEAAAHSWRAPTRKLESPVSASPLPASAAFICNGLYDAKLDGQPVLAMTGLQ